jgi:transcriptional regulator with XRE-family HTH domain/Zn-dependent peptidase ImmA (M78 family)
MIKNERQFGVTQSQARSFEEVLAAARAKDVPEDTDPVIWKAYIDGMESQLGTLKRELEEYSLLKSGKVNRIEVASLEEFPLGIIKARIARGVTHKELADRIGVKPQQIQRWEKSDYETTGFSNFIKIADALKIAVHESISFRHKAQSSPEILATYGIDMKFLQRRLAPNAGNETHEILAAASGYLRKIWGLVVESDGSIDTHTFSCAAAGQARYKLPKDASPLKVRAYTQYAYYMAERVASTIPENSSVVPRDWELAREALCESDGTLSLENVLHKVWKMNIAVIPLSDPIRFHGCCWRINNRNVLVLKQSVRAESRWLFDLLHELYHAGEEAEHTFENMLGDGVDEQRRESQEEQAANRFAGNVLLVGAAENLYKECIAEANGRVANLKKAVQKVAERRSVNLGVLANYVAYSLKADQDIEWWGAASNLQPESDDAHSIVAAVFKDHFKAEKLEVNDRMLVELATMEPTV